MPKKREAYKSSFAEHDGVMVLSAFSRKKRESPFIAKTDRKLYDAGVQCLAPASISAEFLIFFTESSTTERPFWAFALPIAEKLPKKAFP